MGIGYLYYTIAPTLPDVQQLREVQLQLPLRIFTAEGDLIAEYGEKRREPVMISEVPDSLKNAIIAAEDQTFYTHPGVAWQGLARAAFYLIKTGRKGPGGSTITMQVARNFFLTNDRTYDRKIREIFLSFKIESELAKDEILELYINKIYLGTRSYGFAAASRVYYGKPISELEVAESAMLAGLPKAPSRYNPIVNPERALIRRDYVLGRMVALNMIDQATYEDARSRQVTARLHSSEPDVEADYVGEMARSRVEQLFGKNWANAGYRVFTSIRSDQQRAANKALRTALYDYERRHGYIGPITRLEEATLADPEALSAALEELSNPGDLVPAAVMSLGDDNTATVRMPNGIEHVLPFEDVEWARQRISIDSRGDEITQVSEVLAVGDVIALQQLEDGSVRFVQEPHVEGAFIALQPDTGEITALVGGYDYYRSKFNRATQARRQPGSTFKPFIYSAALNAGDTTATIYNDAPVVFHDSALEGEWRPSNYSGRFFGPTRLREALVKSRNLVSVRVLREIGIPYAVDYAQRFGFAPGHLPPDLSLALGNASVTPMEMSGAFAVFANGGYKVTPHFIERVEDPRGHVIYSTPKVVFCDDCDPMFANPLASELGTEGGADEPASGAATADDESLAALLDEDATAEESAAASLELKKVQLDTVDAPRVIDERNAYLMTSMMREVVQRGTARRAGEALQRGDLAGKTGTTNNQLDAWFVGYNPEVVAAAWIGSDGLDPLGRGEAGGVAALPMWTTFMADVVTGTPEEEFTPPEGITTVRIDRKTGEPGAGDNTMLELFMEDNMPDEAAIRRAAAARESAEGEAAPMAKSRSEKVEEVEQLF
ncbi:penicillin-binding protein 1A [Granulosicoccus sp. 3-233]|uniref:penicillin-binding protein 1A n=1 Tax=Granulosicoccus sp. 3-233 TaxID=3417969 RepID=UPI003D334770